MARSAPRGEGGSSVWDEGRGVVIDMVNDYLIGAQIRDEEEAVVWTGSGEVRVRAFLSVFVRTTSAVSDDLRALTDPSVLRYRIDGD